jgi:serine/threonine protein phosphatase PrpC
MKAAAGNLSTLLDIACLSDTGRVRATNEDSCIVAESPPEKRMQKGILLVVADGLGGHSAGEVASSMVTSLLPSLYFEDPEPHIELCLRESLRQVNEAISLEGKKEHAQRGMGSTVVAAAIRGRVMVLANVGDSRGYLLHNGSIQRLSIDHTLIQDVFSFGEDPRRRSSILTQALGPGGEVDPSVHTVEISENDVILLASDGLTGLVPESRILAALLQQNPRQAARRLVEMANAEGGDDNITVIVARVVQAADADNPWVEFLHREPASE